MTETLKSADYYRHPDQPTLIYDIHKPWEEVVAAPPIWLGGFPEKPTEKKYTIFGQPTISPMIIAAGPANGRIWTKFFLDMGYGAVIEKTKRTVPRKSNPMYNIAMVCSDEPLTAENINTPRLGSLNSEDWAKYRSMTNSFGNPSSAIPEWTSTFRNQLLDVADGQILAISVTATVEDSNKTSKELRDEISDPLTREKYTEYLIETETNVIAADFLLGIAAAVGAGAKAVENNKACPNVTENAKEGEMFQDAKLVAVTFRTGKRNFPETKLGMKVGRFSSREQAKRVINAAGDNIDFYSSINALSVPIVDVNGNPILEGRLRAGTCGDILRDLSLRQIEMLAEIRQEEGLSFEIHAGGGLTSVKHIPQFRAAGGDSFFSGSGVLANPLLEYERQLDEAGLLDNNF